MKRLLLSTILLFLFSFHFSLVTAQWHQTNGPYGGSVKSLVVMRNNIFAATWYDAIFLSTNNGGNWKQVNNGLPFGNTTQIEALALVGNTLFATMFTDRVFVSSDSSANWSELKNFPHYVAESFAVNGNTIFVGTNPGGMYKSIDNGVTWIEANNGFPSGYKYVWAIAISGNNIFAGTDDGVYLSTNNGDSWTAVNNGLTNKSVHCLAVSGNNIFTGTSRGMFLSTNNGTKWTSINNGLSFTDNGFTRNQYIMSIAIIGNKIFIGTWNGGVFVSTNNGSSWTPVNNGLPTPIVRQLTVSGTNLFAGTEGMGIFFSSDYGSNWTPVNNGFIDTRPSSFVTIGDNVFTGTYGSGVFLSSNNGDNWTEVNKGLTNTNIFCLVNNGTNLFAGTWGGGVFLSSDNGANWTEVNNGLTYKYITSLALKDKNIFAGTWEGAFLSSNNGNSWTKVNTGLKDTMIKCLAVNKDHVFAGTNTGLYVSSNNGSNWTATNHGLKDSAVFSVATSGNNVFAATGGGVVLSSDNGNSWIEINNNLMNHTYPNSLALKGNILLAGSMGQGVFMSANNDSNWTNFSSGLENKYMQVVGFGNTHVFAGSIGGGVWANIICAASDCVTPLGITIGNITTASAKVSWTGQPCAISYQIHYRPTGSTTWSTTNSPGTTKTISGLQPTTQYDLQIRAKCDQAPTYSKWSTIQTFKTLFACVVPTGITASNLSTTKATISWNAVTGAYSYKVRYRIFGTTTWTTKTAFAPTVYKILSALAANIKYEYQVQTICDASGTPHSSWSAIQTFTSTTRLEEETELENTIAVYPNPTTSNLNISIPSTISVTSIEIFDLLGRKVFTQTPKGFETPARSAGGLSGFNVNMEGQPKGCYFVRINTSEGIVNRKIVLQ